MYKIFGKHAIHGILSNNLRKNVRKFDNYVETNELFVNTSLDEIFKYDKMIFLDNLKDVRNVGSIIRSAAILGFPVLLRNKCCINEITVECAAGGIDATCIAFISDISTTIKKMKQLGFWFIALSERGSLKVPSFNKLILVVGAEDTGISELVYKNCDYSWCLKSNGKFNVYNASISASIAMYQML